MSSFSTFFHEPGPHMAQSIMESTQFCPGRGFDNQRLSHRPRLSTPVTRTAFIGPIRPIRLFAVEAGPCRRDARTTSASPLEQVWLEASGLSGIISPLGFCCLNPCFCPAFAPAFAPALAAPWRSTNGSTDPTRVFEKYGHNRRRARPGPVGLGLRTSRRARRHVYRVV